MAMFMTVVGGWKTIKWQMPSAVIVIVNFFLFIDVVQGYYCEWNLCDSDQYCCGDNLCCNNVYSFWYFWAGVVFLAIMLLSFGGFFRYCYTYRPQIIVHQITNFVPLPNERTCPEEMQGLMAYEDVEVGHSHSSSEMMKNPPPPYSKLSPPIK